MNRKKEMKTWNLNLGTYKTGNYFTKYVKFKIEILDREILMSFFPHFLNKNNVIDI